MSSEHEHNPINSDEGHHNHDDVGHSHNLNEMSIEEADKHLRTDAWVLGGVGAGAIISDLARVTPVKTGLSLGGEDAYWVWMTARKAWRSTSGSNFNRLRASLNASKFSLSTLAGVIIATPFIDSMIENSNDVVAATAFTGTSVAISTASMLEDMRNDRISGYSTNEYDALSRRYRTEGIGLTLLLGALTFKHIGDGNPIIMPIVGGTDCIWTAFRSRRYVSKRE